MLDEKDDFYNSINYDWLINTKLPSNMTRYSEFDKLQEDNLERMKKLVNTLNSTDKSTKNLKTFFDAGISKDREIDDIKPIIEYVKIIKDIESKKDLGKALGKLTLYGIPHIFDIEVAENINDNKNYLIHLDQTTLSLPDSEYYLNPEYSPLINSYHQYIEYGSKVLMNIDIIFNKDDITNIIKFETEIAKLILNRRERRNIKKIYNKVDYQDLLKLKNIDFNEIFNVLKEESETLRRYEIKKLILINKKYFIKLNKIIENTEIKIIKNYLIWKLFNSSLSFLSERLEKLKFTFYGFLLGGQVDIKDKFTRVLSIVSNIMGDKLGQLYGQKYFSHESKGKIEDMIKEIKLALKRKLENSSWMTEITKNKAIKKLERIDVKIGYPDEITNYDKLDLNGNFYKQSRQLYKYLLTVELDKLLKIPNRKEWHMGAHEVNAYYNPVQNEIVFPAGILQPPFYDPNKSDIYNYGSIGTVIGHEICHGFDNQGKKFDEEGNYKNWWSESDDQQYNERIKIMEKQYDNILVENKKVDGKLTLGENIADLCGVSIALDALQNHLKKNVVSTSILNKTYDIKEFYITYAKLWKQLITRQELDKRLKVDPHSPAILRVNQVLRNVDDFYITFNIKPWNKMYLSKEKRVVLW